MTQNTHTQSGILNSLVTMFNPIQSNKECCLISDIMPANRSNLAVGTDQVFCCANSVRKSNIFKRVHVVDEPKFGK